MATQNFAIHLNSADSEYWTITDNASFDYATGNAFTFGLWFRLDWDYSKTTRTYLWSRQSQHAMYVESGELIYYFNGAGGAVTWRTGVRVIPEKTYFLCLTGSESTDTSLILYLDGEAVATDAVTGGMPADAATNLYFGIDYGTTAGYYFKGNMTGWFQSKDTAVTAANVTTLWNGGVYDIDVTEAITGLDDSIGFEEDTGTAYDNALNAGVDGAGQNTPTWVDTVDPMMRRDYNGSSSPVKDFTGVGQNTHQTLVVQAIEFMDATAADDSFFVTDWNGSVIWEAEASADDFSHEKSFTSPLTVHGLKVVTCGGTAKITKLYVTLS